MSKGSKVRPYDPDKWAAGYGRIYGRDVSIPALQWADDTQELIECATKKLEAALVKIAAYDGMSKLTRADCANIARKALENES